MTYLSAYTPPTWPYPPYVNFTLDGEEVVITVRSAPDEHGNCGETTSMRVPAKEFKKMALNAWSKIDSDYDADELA